MWHILKYAIKEEYTMKDELRVTVRIADGGGAVLYDNS